MEFSYQVLYLSDAFYRAYNNTDYPELLSKNDRPYNCLVIEYFDDIFICIPYRTHINHRYSFKFRESVRSRDNKSGLDYSKIIIVKNSDYISDATAVIDNDEYVETRKHINRIVSDVSQYINEYIDYIHGKEDAITEKEFNRKYGYSTLKYFHNELGI